MTNEQAVEEHEAHVADVESRHPKFGAFLRRVTADPEARAAYYEAQKRRDGGQDADDAAELGRVVERGDSAADAGVESTPRGAIATSRVEATSESVGPLGRAWTGLNKSTPPTQEHSPERAPTEREGADDVA